MSNIRWGRIILAAFLLEVAITAVALPVGFAFGNPMSTEPGVPPVDATVFNVAVALACFGFGWLFGAWAVARATSGFALQGLLVGLVAMAMYFGMCAMAPGGLTGVVAAYGLTMFVAFNALRTLGCVLGAAYRGAKISRAAS
jgi:hypothetical protein